ncbi:phosphatase PAP2 family protein [Gordonia sp. HY285]|uniref:phosphatase PAP2 family protein n=1 Tax=Gordonia liuliyuniae TaxID=2911517 RepID=UPI001F3E5EA1|nr:phosphatase PAP2 family protein [Gordonia liuliyuniae]MCF8611947.1 phosphatase PAP2 family protein [Gordonia liuliyuniae]
MLQELQPGFFDRVRRLTSRRVELGTRGWSLVVLALVAFVLVIEIVAQVYDIRGPVDLLAHDFVGRPGIGEIKLAGLVLALVCMPARLRWWMLGAVVLLEGVWNLQRVIVGNPGTVGNGILFGLVGTGLYAFWKLHGSEKSATLKAVGLGLMMPIMGRVGDAWLVLSAKANPKVLDEYVEVADRALGSPSWVLGRIVTDNAFLTEVLSTVYVFLPVGAAVIAFFQLRNVARDGFPRHHIIRTFLLIGMIGPIVYFIFPVVGPAYAFGHEHPGAGWVDVWPWVTPDITEPVARFFDQGIARNCMPSLHTAWATCILLHGLRGSRASRIFGIVWFVCTIAATLGFGYHYAIDILAGIVFTLTIEAALTRPETGWTRFRMGVVAAGFVVFAGLLLLTRLAAVPMSTGGAGAAVLLLAPVGMIAIAFLFVERPELLSVGQRPGGPTTPSLRQRSQA